MIINTQMRIMGHTIGFTHSSSCSCSTQVCSRNLGEVSSTVKQSRGIARSYVMYWFKMLFLLSLAIEVINLFQSEHRIQHSSFSVLTSPVRVRGTVLTLRYCRKIQGGFKVRYIQKLRFISNFFVVP